MIRLTISRHWREAAHWIGEVAKAEARASAAATAGEPLTCAGWLRMASLAAERAAEHLEEAHQAYLESCLRDATTGEVANG